MTASSVDAQRLASQLLGALTPTDGSGPAVLIQEALYLAGLELESVSTLLASLPHLDAVQLAVGHASLKKLVVMLERLTAVVHLCPVDIWRRYAAWQLSNAETQLRDRHLKELRRLWLDRPGCLR